MKSLRWPHPTLNRVGCVGSVGWAFGKGWVEVGCGVVGLMCQMGVLVRGCGRYDFSFFRVRLSFFRAVG